MSFIKGESRTQMMFLSYDELIPSKHIIRLIDSFVAEAIHKEPVKFQYKGNSKFGRSAYSVRHMLSLLIYGYLNKIASSRKLEKECYRNIELMWLIQGLTPDFKTIADFRADNSEMILNFWKFFNKKLTEGHLINLKLVALDSVKLKANASNEEVYELSELKELILKTEISFEKYLSMCIKQDQTDDAEENPEKLTEPELLSKISYFQKKLDKLNACLLKMEEENKKQISVTDPDSSIVNVKGRMIPGYNIEVVVDDENKLVLDANTTNHANDYAELAPALDQLQEKHKQTPEKIVADAGFFSISEIMEAENKNPNTEIFVSIPEHLNNDSHNRDGFIYDKENDCMICPEGKVLRKWTSVDIPITMSIASNLSEPLLRWK